MVCGGRFSRRLRTPTVRAEDLGHVSEEAPTHQGGGTTVTHEAFTVPVTVIKRDELSPAQASNRFSAAYALLSKQFSKALSTEGFLILRGELLSCQHFVTLGAHKTFPVPWGVLVRNAALVDHPITLETPLGVLLLIARHTHDLLVTWDKTLASYWLQTDLTTEALLMPLLALVLKLLHTCLEEPPTAVTPGRKVVVMTISAVEPVVLVGKRMIN